MQNTNIEILERLIKLENLILEKFIILEEKIDIINNKLKEKEKRIENIELSCNKLNNHIDFIEETYSTLRTPLDFVKNKVENYLGYDNKKLPQLKN